MVTYFSPEVESPTEGTWVDFRQCKRVVSAVYQRCCTDRLCLVWLEVEKRHAILQGLREGVVGGCGREGQEVGEESI